MLLKCKPSYFEDFVNEGTLTLVSQSFWSYDWFMEMAGLKAVIPPLGIITVAALLPKDWDIRFYDRNVNPDRW